MAGSASPQNDDIINATPISAARASQSTIGSTTASGEDTSVEAGLGAPAGGTVWFSYTAQQTGPVSIDTNGSDFDTTLQVFALTNPGAGPSYGNLTEVTSNDDNEAGGDPNSVAYLASTVEFNAVAGQTYYIQAGGYDDPVDGTARGTLVINTSPVPCYVTGTLIRTMRGDVAVEDLKVGDIAVTGAGRQRPVTWIGRRAIAAEGGTLAFEQQPVRIRAGAFGQGLPLRDLWLSPGHPVLVGADPDGEGGALVPVMCLINGTTITREPRTRVTYWHIELDSHDILIAEGLPAESYIDLGTRVWFGGRDGIFVDPDRVWPDVQGRCRPVAVDGPIVDRERLRLDAVFATLLGEQCGWNSGAEWAAA